MKSFSLQYLKINTGNATISEASSPKAYQQYRDAIYPLYKTSDNTRYWQGKFTQPVQGLISTAFGLLRYTNGSKTPTGHSDVDIAAKTGTEVLKYAHFFNTGLTVAE